MALKQPPYRPPPQVFGPVWTVLYGLMGYAAYRAWDTGMASLNPNVVALTKVLDPFPSQSPRSQDQGTNQLLID